MTLQWMKRHVTRPSKPTPFKLKYHVREVGIWNFQEQRIGHQLYELQAVTAQGD
jgi:hypothetical protein